jgi:hypothetical protein
LVIFDQERLGSGAFAIVCKGYIKGPAPILRVYGNLVLMQAVNCNVAVKMVPPLTETQGR